eukprot:Gb_00329 [translate_table: standard]
MDRSPRFKTQNRYAQRVEWRADPLGVSVVPIGNSTRPPSYQLERKRSVLWPWPPIIRSDIESRCSPGWPRLPRILGFTSQRGHSGLRFSCGKAGHDRFLVLAPYGVPPFRRVQNIGHMLLFQVPEWDEDWKEWGREIHIKCTYDGIEFSKIELPDGWLKDDIQIKILFPFRWSIIDDQEMR